MKILISPYAQNLRNGAKNPKDFPYWVELVALLKERGFEVIQIGAAKDNPIEGITDFRQGLKLKEIANLIIECDIWLSVDSFLPHLNQCYTKTRGIVIFSKSDPKIFGYVNNINLLKDRSYLRENQFWLWEQEEYDKDAFVTAEEVYKAILKELWLK